MLVRCWWCNGIPDFYEGCKLCRGSGTIRLEQVSICKHANCTRIAEQQGFCYLHLPVEDDFDDIVGFPLSGD